MMIDTELLDEHRAIVIHPLATRSECFQDAFEVARGNAVDKLRRLGHSQVVDVRRPFLGIVELGLTCRRLTVPVAFGPTTFGAISCWDRRGTTSERGSADPAFLTVSR